MSRQEMGLVQFCYIFRHRHPDPIFSPCCQKLRSTPGGTGRTALMSLNPPSWSRTLLLMGMGYSPLLNTVTRLTILSPSGTGPKSSLW